MYRPVNLSDIQTIITNNNNNMVGGILFWVALFRRPIKEVLLGLFKILLYYLEVSFYRFFPCGNPRDLLLHHNKYNFLLNNKIKINRIFHLMQSGDWERDPVKFVHPAMSCKRKRTVMRSRTINKS